MYFCIIQNIVFDYYKIIFANFVFDYILLNFDCIVNILFCIFIIFIVGFLHNLSQIKKLPFSHDIQKTVSVHSVLSNTLRDAQNLCYSQSASTTWLYTEYFLFTLLSVLLCYSISFLHFLSLSAAPLFYKYKAYMIPPVSVSSESPPPYLPFPLRQFSWS